MTNLFGRTKFFQFFLASALLLASGPAFAEKRVALVIGILIFDAVNAADLRQHIVFGDIGPERIRTAFF